MLYAKSKPRKLEQFIGNRKEIGKLIALRDAGIIPNRLIISGPFGCGKTGLAGVIAKDFGKERNSIHSFAEYIKYKNCARVSAKDLSDELNVIFQCRNIPTLWGKPIYIYDEVQVFKRKDFLKFHDALDTLNSDIMMIFVTQDPSVFPPAFLSRCHHTEMNLLSNLEIERLLKRAIKRFKIEISDSSLRKVIVRAEGQPRLALTELESYRGYRPKA